MTPHSPEQEPGRPAFPTLPIVTPDPPRRSASERFGGLFYLAIIGLLVLLTLIGWFSWRAWSLRHVWSNVYVLHDASRPEAERVEAAYALSRDPEVNQRQLWDIALRRQLPPLARYVVAEGLTAEAAVADPRAYGTAVARSEGWPVWLRLLLIRPIAYAAAMDLPVDRPSLVELTKNDDAATRLWATFALAVGPEGEASQAARLRQAVQAGGPETELASLLVRALESPREPERLRTLDEATLSLRTNQPDAAALWDGWTVEGSRLIPTARRATPSASAGPS